VYSSVQDVYSCEIVFVEDVTSMLGSDVYIIQLREAERGDIMII